MIEVAQPYRRKLIEVSLPPNDISEESANEKYLKRGHPLTLHTWWARRPLAACRAVIFASLVDDPASCTDEFPSKQEQKEERDRLHRLLARISKWKNINEQTAAGANLMNEARYEVARSIARSRREKAPTDPEAVLEYLTDKETGLTIYDPFSGGGSIPLEAQRLGLNAVGSDLNPVSVLITKSTIEIPVPYKDNPPVNRRRESNELTHRTKRRGISQRAWRGYSGLADDIRYYGHLVGEDVFKRVGRFYPSVSLETGSVATVVAWLWANTVPCPSPACEINMPLIRSFQISRHKDRPRWIRPMVTPHRKSIAWDVVADDPKLTFERTAGREGAICLACEASVPLEYVRQQGVAGQLGQQLIAIAAEDQNQRVYVRPNQLHETIANNIAPFRRPHGQLPLKGLGIRTRGYGFFEWHQLFTDRQINTLCTFSDVLSDITGRLLADGGTPEYATAVKSYLALAVGRLVHNSSRLCKWYKDSVAGVFGRQTINMVWDFAELNPFCNSSQRWNSQVDTVAKVVEHLPTNVSMGKAFQADAANHEYDSSGPVIVTDPPYYDNIGYADISDFFYIWHRDMLGESFPELFLGTLTPKQDEIIAGPMFKEPRQRFEGLLSQVLKSIRSSCSNEFPSSIFYAYMQKETTENGTSSTGWETFLTAVSNARLKIVGTWPLRTEQGAKLNSQQRNALASSVVIVTRPRDTDARIATRQQFIAQLKAELPAKLDQFTQEDNIAPVDLAQAAIGPGMEIYTKYSSVETIEGDPVLVRDALAEINRVVGDYFLSEQGELDTDTQFCIDWLKEHGFGEGPFGDAEVLAKAKDIAIGALVSQGLLEAKRGRVSLLPMEAFETLENEVNEISPNTTSWEGLMRVAFQFQFPEEGRGVEGAAEIIREMGPKSEEVERLARILFDHFDRKFEPANSRVYNDIADAWRDIRAQAGFGRQLTSDLPV